MDFIGEKQILYENTFITPEEFDGARFQRHEVLDVLKVREIGHKTPELPSGGRIRHPGHKTCAPARGNVGVIPSYFCG